MKNIYRIEIKSKCSEYVFFFWIGKDLELVSVKSKAIPVTNEEHLFVMNKIACEAYAFLE